MVIQTLESTRDVAVTDFERREVAVRAVRPACDGRR
jgi:hypothetical protein